jgi:hypothetical protein
MQKYVSFLTLVLIAWVAAACQQQQVAVDATDTLAPIVSLTPRSTATPVPSRTPTPTLTLTPSISPIPPTASSTPTPTVPPPVIGVVQSVQDVNIRDGPGTGFDAVVALRPGTGVEVLGRSPDGAWYNIVMEDGREGWISATLVYIQPSATPPPSLTPLPNLTALAANPQPTDIFGNTITPTLPRSASTATPVGSPAAPSPSPIPGGDLPIIDINAINQTATALAGGAGAVPTQRPAGGPTGGPIIAATTPAPSGPAAVANRIDVFAWCDNRALGPAAPTNLAAGSTIDIFWAWFAATRQQVDDHVANVVHELRLNGNLLQVGAPEFIRPSAGGGYEAYWFIPAGPLAAGQYQISYAHTWRAAVFDGSLSFGPGTGTPEERGTCTFTVR